MGELQCFRSGRLRILIEIAQRLSTPARSRVMQITPSGRKATHSGLVDAQPADLVNARAIAMHEYLDIQVLIRRECVCNHGRLFHGESGIV